MPRTRRRCLYHALVALIATAAASAQAPTWVQRQAVMPPGTCGGKVAYFAPHGQTMLVTGTGCHQSWTWDGVAWMQRTLPVPASFNAFQLCYDSLRGKVVGVFGDQSTGLQTWEWDGFNWFLFGVGGPPARHSSALAFDQARGVTLLFGGSNGNSYGYADLWAWNGQTWTQIANGGPTPRWGSAMVFDEQKQTVMLFGGEGPNAGQSISLGDTWEWNGTYWQNHFGLAGPPARRYHSMAYDSHRHRTVLYGGSVSLGALTDMWEWNGSAWTQLQPIANPGDSVAGLAYDSSRGVMVTWKGSQSPSQTWEYLAGPGVPATFATYGAGCAGPNGVPQLDSIGGSVPRVGTSLQLLLSNLPPSPVNVPFGLIGLDATSWNGVPLPADLTPAGFTGCQAWLAPLASVGLSNQAGTATWAVPIPVNAFYLGADLYFQGAVLQPGWNPAGIILSNAGHGVIGNP